MYFNRVKLVSIKPLNLDNPLFKEIIMTNEAGENYTFRFECSQPYLWWVSKDGGDNSKKYNKTFIELLRKNLCFFKNGKYVPKADIASVETKTGEPMAEGKKVIRLTESDLVQLIKRIISENK